jgi:uncharacterized protein
MSDSNPYEPMREIADELPRPEPVVHPESEPFWDGLGIGELRIQVCADCGAYRFPVAPVCYRCRSFDYAWTPIEPTGRTSAVVEVTRATGDAIWGVHVPYLSGTVDVAHDLRLPGRILCSCGSARERGVAVHAVVLTARDRRPVHAWAHTCMDSG